MTHESILIFHSIIGVIIFVAGLLRILLKKGGRTHVIIGKIYLYGWLFLLVSGAFLGGLLITIFGIFGFYFALTGSRIGQMKYIGITLFEKSIFVLGGLIPLSMLYYSITLYLRGETSFSIMFAVFGAIFLFTVLEDIYKYILEKPLKKQVYGALDWYFEHLKRMCISFIAAVTAFTSIQNVFSNNTANFLVPTVVGTILISIATKSYKKKLIK
jgi:hypothetical protein